MTVKENETSLLKANSLLGLQLLSDIGDQITYALLALSVLDITKSTQDVGLVYLIEIFGLIIFTFIGGILGDKYSRKKILFCSDLGRAFVVLMMIMAFKYESISLIYLTAFTLSILGALHTPANMSVWAQYVPVGKLTKYNSLSQTVKHATTIVGPFIAGFFIIQNWISFGFALDSLTFLICAIGFAKIVVDKNTPELPPAPPQQSLWDGFKIIFKHSSLKRYVAYDAIQMISFGAFNATFLVLAQRDFGWSKTDYSYHLSIVAIFTFLGGGLGATNLVAKINDSKKLIFCSIISASAYLLMLHTKTFPTSSILIGICDGLAIMTISVTRTRGQLIGTQLYPDSLASIMAARRVIISGATLIGTLSCIYIDNFISLESTFKIFVVPLYLSLIPIALRKRSLYSTIRSTTVPQAIKLK